MKFEGVSFCKDTQEMEIYEARDNETGAILARLEVLACAPTKFLCELVTEMCLDIPIR